MVLTMLADDLSGAVEAAQALRGTSGRPAVVWLRPPGPAEVSSAGPHAVQVLDAQLRPLAAGPRRRRVRVLLGEATTPGHVKVDSALRGGVVDVLAGAARRGPVLFAPSLPVLGRTVLRGRLRLPHPVAAVGEDPSRLDVAGLAREAGRSRHLDLAEVRADDLTALLAAAFAEADLVSADAEDEDDLDRLAAAGLQRPGLTLVGSAGLTAALGRRVPPVPHGGRTAAPVPVPTTTDRPLLVVLGTRSEAAQAQLAALDPRVGRLVLDPCDPGATHRLALVLPEVLDRSGCAVLRAESRRPVPPGAVATALAGVATGADRAVVVLLGGQTARAFLDVAGATRLTVGPSLGYGAALCQTDTGRTVVTRPGSFGAPSALADLLTVLRGAGPGPVTSPRERTHA